MGVCELLILHSSNIDSGRFMSFCETKHGATVFMEAIGQF